MISQHIMSCMQHGTVSAQHEGLGFEGFLCGVCYINLKYTIIIFNKTHSGKYSTVEKQMYMV